MRDKYLKEEVDSSMTYKDEFNASFLVYKNTPNLTNDERKMLLEHAYEIARDGMLDDEIKMCKEIVRIEFNNE